MVTRNGRAALIAALLCGVVSACRGGSKDATTYAIGGTITGLTGSGLILATPGQPDLTVASGATTFAFATPVDNGTPYDVSVKQQPASPAQTCSVASGTGTVDGADVTAVQVTCVNAGPFLIGGSISGLLGTGLVLTTPGQPDLTVASGATTFAFATPVAGGTVFAVSVKQQPASPAQSCGVASGTGTVEGADVTTVRVACVNAGLFLIGGTVTGLPDCWSSNSLLTLSTPGLPDLAVPWGSTTFTFGGGVATGAPYDITVTIQPVCPGAMRLLELFYSCVVSGGSGVVAGADVTGIAVTCMPGQWLAAGAMAVPRAYFALARGGSPATTLWTLAAGGQKADPDWATATTEELVESWSPGAGSTQAWEPLASMSTPRSWACSVLLPSGQFLVAGGVTPTASLATAEVYDHDANTWTPTAGPMAVPRGGGPGCVLLDSGKVLVAGGLGTVATASAELFDPATGLFTPTGSMVTARYWHTTTKLIGGRVLVAGGCVGGWPCTTATDSSEVYDPATGLWSSAGSMPGVVQSHSATLLPSGEVLVAGGCLRYSGAGSCGDGPNDRRASLYDPAIGPAGTWTATGSLQRGHSDHVALVLGSGDVLVVGGSFHSGSGKVTERYDAASGTWSYGPPTLVDHGSGLRAAPAPCLMDGIVVGGSPPPFPPQLYTGFAEYFATAVSCQ